MTRWRFTFRYLQRLRQRLEYKPEELEEIKIGDQVWSKKNLNTDRFNNGDIIPHAKTEEQWKKAALNKQPAWCYFKNDVANGTKLGKLYNWYAVNDPRGIAPDGWRIPTDSDWKQLVNYLGGSYEMGWGYSDPANKMKSTTGWGLFKEGGGKELEYRSCFGKGEIS